MDEKYILLEKDVEGNIFLIGEATNEIFAKERVIDLAKYREDVTVFAAKVIYYKEV